MHPGAGSMHKKVPHTAPMKVETGAAEAVYNNQTDNPLFSKPVFQIVKFEKVDRNTEEKPRVRVNLSDGVHYVKGIFSSTYTGHFDRGVIKNLYLVRLDTFVVRSKDGNYFVYIQKLDEFSECNRKIGNPVNVATKKESIPEGAGMCKVQGTACGRPNDGPAGKGQALNAERGQTKRVKTDEDVVPISALNPFLNRWAVKGRVVLKSDIRHFNSQRGEGKVFSLELADASAQIKVVGFNEIVDVFYPIFEVGKSYKVTKGTVRMANKQFSNNNMDYEIHLDKATEVVQVLDDCEPRHFFSFTRIGDLRAGASLVDVIGVVKEVYPVGTVVIRSTQKENRKRDMILMDESGSVRVTFWGTKTEIELDDSPVVAIKSARAGEYNGVSLSTVSATQVLVNPDLERAFELKGWYESTGRNLQVSLPRREEKRSLIRDVKDNELEYSFVVGKFIYLKEDGLWYDSCPGENCSKKVVLEGDGRYRCEKCNETYDSCNQRYMISAHVGDFTGQMWVTIFNDVGAGVMGLPAERLKAMSENSPMQLQTAVKSLYFRDYGLKIRARQDFYNNEMRMRYNVISATNISTLDQCKWIIDAVGKVLS